MVVTLATLLSSCSAPALREGNPEERLQQVRNNIQKHQYESAMEGLEELRYVTAGTKLGGEVQFLLGETSFLQGKLPEAESHFSAYLTAYPEGPFAEKALYRQATSKIKQLQKIRVGFLTFRSYIPHDRDASLLREARVLFELYAEMYPEGEWAAEADQRAKELREKEGEHELDIANFYLKRDRPEAALLRAEEIVNGDYSEDLRARARTLSEKARSNLPSGGSIPPSPRGE